ncbi:heme biosynthesis protein HemY [Tropicimonas sp. IMCC34011]|uniref:heme biosynthesis protein HemY n=1 Tax=Tropicimonas sp. IMCC34011 TaxID=2248759 RepID=UPI000E22588F|nr:heme biosynthesis HemY N-terminal domain-containing protein [Tropicimonas sp. IMCC34011]
MLWSLLKIILFVAVVALVTIGAGWLMETGAGIRVAFGGTELNLGPVQAIIAILVIVAAVWLVLKILGALFALVRFLNGDETALSRHFDRRSERKGMRALAEGMVALAEGEGRLAMAKAERAKKYLNEPQLVALINAQGAEMEGQHKVAEENYKSLLADERTRFVGIRGILRQRLAEGDTETALALSEKAFALRPKHEETQDTLLRLQAEKADWKGARKTLDAKLRSGALPRDVHRRRDAVLALSEARDVLVDGQDIEAREAAIEANRLSPDLIPAAVLAARSYISAGKQRYAARVLKKAWEAQPHPDLAATFADIAPGEDPAKRLKRFSELTKVRPEHPETKMLQAELLIAAEDFPAARRALGDLPTAHPTARSLSIMAAIERGEGADDAVVRGWLARAVTAPRGSQWVCENCHVVAAEWAPVCPHCHAFDTLAWAEPPEGQLSSPTGSEMLPLLVGSEASTAATVAPGPALATSPQVDVTPPTHARDADTPPAETKAVPEAEPADAPEDAQKEK